MNLDADVEMMTSLVHFSALLVFLLDAMLVRSSKQQINTWIPLVSPPLACHAIIF